MKISIWSKSLDWRQRGPHEPSVLSSCEFRDPRSEELPRSGTMQQDHSPPLVNRQPLITQVSEVCQCGHGLFFPFFLKPSIKVLWLEAAVG